MKARKRERWGDWTDDGDLKMSVTFPEFLSW